MVVERFTWKAKVGCNSEVVKFVKAMVEESGLAPRVCTYTFGPSNIVTSDLDFETEEDRRKFWTEIDPSAPAFVEWHQKYTDLVESYGRELLQVH